MKLMKLSAAFAAAALLLASCSTPTNSTLSSTDLANKSSIPATLVSGNSALALNITSAPTGNLTATTATNTPTTQYITVGLNKPILINSSNVVPGLTIYNLSNTSATPATAFYTEGATIPYTATQATSGSTTTLTLAITAANLPATTSAKIEVVFSAATVTDATGLQKLDSNGNNIPGEATDDYIQYLNVTNGVAVPAGLQKNPLGKVSIAGANASTVGAAGAITAAGGTFAAGPVVPAVPYTLIFNLLDSIGGTNVSATAIFDNKNVKLQQFDYDARTWTDLTYSVTAVPPAAGSALNTPIVVTLTSSAAPIAGATYRVFIVDQTAITESSAVGGYIHAYGYGVTTATATSSSKNAVLFTAGKLPGKYINASTGYEYKNFTVASVTSSFAGSAPTVSIQFNGGVGNLGTAGIDPASVTAANVKIFLNATGSSSTSTAIEWTSAAVSTTSTLNDTLVLTLPANYSATSVTVGGVTTTPGTAATVRIYGLIDQGALAATGVTAGTGKAKLVDITQGPSNTLTVSSDLAQAISGFKL